MILHAFAELPVYIGGPVFIGLIVLISVLGGLLLHRLFPHAVLEQHNEIAGFVLAVVGVVYAVLLAFLAIGVWERFEAADQRTYDEAVRLTEVYRKADLFPQGHLLRSELTRYVGLIVDDEWSDMQRGVEDPKTDALAELVASQVRHMPVTSAAQQNGHASMMANMDEALMDRDYRTSMSSLGVNRFMWVILIAGGVVTIAFSYLFAYSNRWALVAIVGLLAFSLALVLYLIAAVDYPFRGEIRIGPEAFENALHSFKIIGS